jgi:hypothetical protein
MSLKQIVTMGFGKSSGHGLAIGGHLVCACTLDEIDVGLVTQVFFVLLDLI